MLKAKATRLEAYEVYCPYCKAPIGSPNTGGHVWIPMDDRTQSGTATCGECGKPSYIPAVITQDKSHR